MTKTNSTLLPWSWHIKSTLRLAVPVMAGQVGHVITMFFDTVMVGRVGTADLAAAALSNALFFTFVVLGMGLTMGITPLVAIADGEKDHRHLPAVLKNGVAVVMTLGVVLAGAMLAGSPAIRWLGQDAAVATKAVPYFQVITVSMLPLLFFLAYKQFAEGLSLTKAAMVVSLAGNAVNVALNYVLIFGKLGFPALGLMGAGYATLISRGLMAVALLVVYRRDAVLAPFLQAARRVGVSWERMKQVVRIGLPISTQMFFEVTAFSVAAVMAGWLGAPQQAAHSLVLNLATITFMAAHGIGAAATVKVGNRLGERNLPELRRAARACTALVVGWMGLAGLVFLLGRYPLVALYTSDPVVTEFAVYSMFFAAAFQLSDGLQVVGLGALRGIKEVAVPTWFTLVSYWGVSLPVSYVLAFPLGMELGGIWIGFVTGLSTSALLMQWWFHRRVRRLSLGTAAAAAEPKGEMALPA